MLYSGQQLWLLLKSLGILSSTLWKTKEITSLIISSKNATLMGSTDKMSVTVQKTTFAGDNLKCIIQENTKKWPVKKKNKIEDLKATGIMKKRNSSCDPIISQSF